MTPRGERIAELANALCAGKRYNAANNHVQSAIDVERITGIKHIPSEYFSFLSGWDAALQITHAELLEENHELHGMVMALCQRLCIERCKACRGTGCDDNIDPCPHCDDGWIDKPVDEQLIRELKGTP